MRLHAYDSDWSYYDSERNRSGDMGWTNLEQDGEWHRYSWDLRELDPTIDAKGFRHVGLRFETGAGVGSTGKPSAGVVLVDTIGVSRAQSDP